MTVLVRGPNQLGHRNSAFAQGKRQQYTHDASLAIASDSVRVVGRMLDKCQEYSRIAAEHHHRSIKAGNHHG